MQQRITIIRQDNTVVVDGVGASVDCAELPQYVHAIQWFGTDGWIEFAPDAGGKRSPNLKIVEIAPYGFLVDRHSIEVKRCEDARIEQERLAALSHDAAARSATAARANMKKIKAG